MGTENEDWTETLSEMKVKLKRTILSMNNNFSSLLKSLKIDKKPCIPLGHDFEKSIIHKRCDVEIKTHNLIQQFYDLLEIVSTLRDILIFTQLKEINNHKKNRDDEFSAIKNMYDEAISRTESLIVECLKLNII